METLQDLIAQRRAKLERWSAAGHEAWPYRFDRSHSVSELLESFDQFDEEQVEITLAGRLVAKRVMGKAAFAHLHDDTDRIQIYVKRDEINPEGAEGPDTPYSLFKNATDLGDWLGVRGRPMVTKTGEKTLQVSQLTLLAKSLRPLPVVKEDAESGKRYHEYSDPDERYRNRAMDLIVNPEEREVFRTRARIIRAIRQELDGRGFLEVETPVLQPLYGGGTARPFVTHHNQLKKDLYLRIADELYLKRLVVGGLPKVYEIAKDFRNEGVDRTHNPEFTMMECYAALEDYGYMMELLETMVSRLVEEQHGSSTLNYDGQAIDCSLPWRRVSYFDALEQATGRDMRGASLDEVQAFAKEKHIEFPDGASWGKVMDEIFGELVEPTLADRATFVIDYPLELSPLAKRHRSDERLVERFEAFLGGFEIANSFSELNDPIDQRERLEQQQAIRAGGEDDAMPLDEDYLEVMELGMPPMGGLGLGIDRLVMLLTDRSTIRDVILFPLLRDRVQAGDEEPDEGDAN